MQQQRSTEIIGCPKSMVGRVIGKNGETIKALQSYCGALIQIDQTQDPTRITISGTPESLSMAVSMVSDIVKGTFKGFALLRQVTGQHSLPPFPQPLPQLLLPPSPSSQPLDQLLLPPQDGGPAQLQHWPLGGGYAPPLGMAQRGTAARYAPGATLFEEMVRPIYAPGYGLIPASQRPGEERATASVSAVGPAAHSGTMLYGGGSGGYGAHQAAPQQQHGFWQPPPSSWSSPSMPSPSRFLLGGGAMGLQTRMTAPASPQQHLGMPGGYGTAPASYGGLPMYPGQESYAQPYYTHDYLGGAATAEQPHHQQQTSHQQHQHQPPPSAALYHQLLADAAARATAVGAAAAAAGLPPGDDAAVRIAAAGRMAMMLQHHNAGAGGGGGGAHPPRENDWMPPVRGGAGASGGGSSGSSAGHAEAVAQLLGVGAPQAPGTLAPSSLQPAGGTGAGGTATGGTPQMMMDVHGKVFYYDPASLGATP